MNIKFNRGNEYFDTYYIYNELYQVIGIIEDHCRQIKRQYFIGWKLHNLSRISGSLTGETKAFDTKEEALSKGETTMHNKEQQMHEAYYKTIADEILNYDQVVLFGPTNAKSELYNYLNKDLHFKDIKIDVESADNMTDNEKDAFVRNYFENI